MKMSLEKDSSKDICLSLYFSRKSVATPRTKVLYLHKIVSQNVCVLLSASLVVFCFKSRHLKLPHKMPFQTLVLFVEGLTNMRISARQNLRLIDDCQRNGVNFHVGTYGILVTNLFQKLS